MISMKRKSKEEEEEQEEEEDRLTALPDALIHHIFSFLDMKLVVKTCILSTRWRYLWLSASTLNFNNDKIECDVHGGYCSCVGVYSRVRLIDRFGDFVDRVLINGSSTILKFKLTDHGKLKTALLRRCLIAALGRKVQDIDMDLSCFMESRILPNHIFSSNVRVLKLRCKTKLPSTMCVAARIKDLDLKYVVLPDGNGRGELVLSFPVLDNLVIEQCDVSHLKIVSIIAPALETMKLRSLYTDQDSACEVKTCTPNLKSLEVFQHLSVYSRSVDYCMDNLSALVSAYILIYHDISYESVKDSVKERLRCWVKAVPWMYGVQALKLRVSSVQVLLDSPKLLERLPGVFCNLKHVMLVEDRVNFHIDAVLKFLERAPHIETLVLKRCEGLLTRETGEEWIPNLPPQHIFNHLQSFEIQNFNGFKVEMRFLEFLLVKAVVLKKIIIKTKKKWLLGEAKEEISSFARASSSVSILFQICELNM